MDNKFYQKLQFVQGVLRPGDQLPAERELAQQLDVSRPSLRDAIKELEKRGLLITRRGGRWDVYR